MATSPANPAEIQDRAKNLDGKPDPAKEQDKGGQDGDSDRRAESSDTGSGNK